MSVVVTGVGHEPHRWHVGFTVVVGSGTGQHLPRQPTVRVDVGTIAGQVRSTQIRGQGGGKPTVVVKVAQAAVVMVWGGIVIVLLGQRIGTSGLSVGMPRVGTRRLERWEGGKRLAG